MWSGCIALPLGIALNFLVNGRDVLVPMAIEEPSVVAGASFMAKLARAGGGFQRPYHRPGDDRADAGAGCGRSALLPAWQSWSRKADAAGRSREIDPVLKKLGGGPRDLEVRMIDESPIGPFLVVHLIYDVRDAMGANAVNTAAERLAPRLAALTGGRVHLRILSNLADRRLARARCTIPLDELAFDEFQRRRSARWHHRSLGFRRGRSLPGCHPQQGHHERRRCGGDRHWQRLAGRRSRRACLCRPQRALHFAQHLGQGCRRETWSARWRCPWQWGLSAGATRVHPDGPRRAQADGRDQRRQLAEIIVSVGLAQNLAALRALATEGIQRGHMGLHARQVAIAAGAEGEQIERLAQQLVAEKNRAHRPGAKILNSESIVNGRMTT